MPKSKPASKKRTTRALASSKPESKKGATNTFSPEAKIHLLVKENPKRKGSKEAKRFDKYKNGMSIAQAKELGMDNTNFARDVRLGFIRIGA